MGMLNIEDKTLIWVTDAIRSLIFLWSTFLGIAVAIMEGVMNYATGNGIYL
jgi:hypothetical protein